MLSQGILLGLGLSLLVGPLIVALLEASLTQGFRAGLAVGIGIWVSDALYILVTYFGLSYIQVLTAWNGFEITLGLIGGLVLIGFGLGAILLRPQVNIESINLIPKKKSYLKWGIKGFLINTLNPFTVLFWTGVASGIIAKPGFQPTDALPFYLGLFSMIVLSDSIKIWLAKLIRKKIRSGFTKYLQLSAGIALLCFGVALIIRSVWFL
ncbi:MAG: LysE family transporter [Saprospiraceae bacterium]|nr:LysE family transporter [Saprospiraceae bacterium]